MIWGEKEAIYVGKCLVLPFYYSFSLQNPIFFISAGSCSVLPWQSGQKGGGKKIVLSKGMEVNTVSVRENYSFNTRGPFDLWENKCYRELWINEEAAKYSFFHLPLVHRIVDKCPLASSTFTDVTFLLVSVTRSLSLMQHALLRRWLKQRWGGGCVPFTAQKAAERWSRAPSEPQRWPVVCEQHAGSLHSFHGRLNYLHCLLTILFCSFPL